MVPACFVRGMRGQIFSVGLMSHCLAKRVGEKAREVIYATVFSNRGVIQKNQPLPLPCHISNVAMLIFVLILIYHMNSRVYRFNMHRLPSE